MILNVYMFLLFFLTILQMNNQNGNDCSKCKGSDPREYLIYYDDLCSLFNIQL